MRIYNYKRFEHYLDRVCKNDFLREGIKDFYKMLNQRNVEIDRSIFGEIFVCDEDGSTSYIKSDIVKFLEKNKINQISYADLFIYNFINYVKMASFCNPTLNGKKDYTVGSFSYDEKKISLSTLKNEKDREARLFKMIMKNGVNSYIVDNKMWDNIDEMYKSKNRLTLFHELCHLLEVRTYNNNQYFQIGLMTVAKYLKEQDFYVDCHSLFFEKHFDNLLESDLYYMKGLGNFYLSELFNEMFTAEICGMGKLIDRPLNHKQSGIHWSKKEFTISPTEKRIRDCLYDYDYDIYKLIKLVLSKNDYNIDMFRLNPSMLSDEINSLGLSQARVKYYKSKIAKNASELISEVYPPQEKNINTQKINNLLMKNNLSNYEILTLAIGVAYSYLQKNYCDEFQDMKVMIENMLLDIYKTKTTKRIKNAVVNENYSLEQLKSLLMEVDSELQEIDDVLLYQGLEKKVPFYKVKNDTINKKMLTQETLLPLREMKKLYPKDLNITFEKQVLDTVLRSVVKNFEKPIQIFDKMKFCKSELNKIILFEKNKQLEKQYEMQNEELSM